MKLTSADAWSAYLDYFQVPELLDANLCAISQATFLVQVPSAMTSGKDNLLVDTGTLSFPGHWVGAGLSCDCGAGERELARQVLC